MPEILDRRYNKKLIPFKLFTITLIVFQATVPMVQDVTFFTMRRRTRSSPSMEATPPPGPETVAAVEVVER